MSHSIRVPSDTSSQKSTSFDDSSSEETVPGQWNPSTQIMGQQACTWNQEQTYSNPGLSVAELQHQFLHRPRFTYVQPAFEPHRPRVPSRRCRMNMEVTVDLEGLLPDGAQDPTTGQPVVNLDSISIFTFSTFSQLQDLTKTSYPRTLLGWFQISHQKKGLL